MKTISYWNNNGTHNILAKQVEQLIPGSGEVDQPKKNRALEKFRKASNCYYDLFNNGLCNRAADFRAVFPGLSKSTFIMSNRKYTVDPAPWAALEEKMDKIILAAAKEQNITAE